MTDHAVAGRESKTERMRESLRKNALRLMLRDGYDATTVEAISSAAGVSHMTFFRHFASKEQVLLDDGFAEELLAAFAGQPAELSLTDAMRNALVDVYSDIPDHEAAQIRRRDRLVMSTPALRAAWLERHRARMEQILDIAAARTGRDRHDMVIRTFGWTMYGVITAGATHWQDDPDATLVASIEAAFDCYERREF